MDKYLNPEFIQAQLLIIKDWLFAEIFTLGSLGQLATIAIAYFLARMLDGRIDSLLSRLAKWRSADYWITKSAETLALLSMPLVWLFFQWISSLVALAVDWPHHLLTITVSLLTAWIIIRLTTSLIRDKTYSKLVATTAWAIAALNILQLLDPTIEFLDSHSLDLGDLSISALTVIKGAISLAILLWLAKYLSGLLEKRIAKLANITPSVQMLVSKFLRFTLVAIAILVALTSIGIDLTVFAVFSGAIGIGLGLGLQKALSNLIGGITILIDKSIKPGDVIEVSGSYGWVKTLGGRYISVITRDGIEHLIPNDEILTQRVANWTHSDSNVRIRVPVGVSYKCDLHQAIQLCRDAAGDVERVLEIPAPNCLVLGFGDNSVDLEIRAWIADPRNGVANIRSQIYLNVWDKFREANIEIPYPQRDIHIKSGNIGQPPNTLTPNKSP